MSSGTDWCFPLLPVPALPLSSQGGRESLHLQPLPPTSPRLSHTCSTTHVTVHTSSHAQSCTHMCTHAHPHTQVHTCFLTNVYTHTSTTHTPGKLTHVCSCTRSHAHMHIHAHSCTRLALTHAHAGPCTAHSDTCPHWQVSPLAGVPTCAHTLTHHFSVCPGEASGPSQPRPPQAGREGGPPGQMAGAPHALGWVRAGMRRRGPSEGKAVPGRHFGAAWGRGSGWECGPEVAGAEVELHMEGRGRGRGGYSRLSGGQACSPWELGTEAGSQASGRAQGRPPPGKGAVATKSMSSSPAGRACS